MRASIEEYKAVEEAAMKFVKSVAEGNSKYAKELFIDEAVLFGYLDGKLEHGSIEQFYKNVDSVGAGNDFKARIDVIDVEETLAVVHFENVLGHLALAEAVDRELLAVIKVSLVVCGSPFFGREGDRDLDGALFCGCYCVVHDFYSD